MSLSGFPALVLNADYRPLSLYPLKFKDAHESIRNVYEDTVTVVEEYDRVVRSPSYEMRLPSVVALKTYVHTRDRVAFTRRNVFLRDRFRCQYCGSDNIELTFDHVVPRAAGGETNWTNIVAACTTCNSMKGSKQDMQPMKVPREPTPEELRALTRYLAPKYIHHTWRAYLPAEMLEAA